MQQWWDALSLLHAMLQDSEALGLSREARRRLIGAIGALDKALLNCATADCPIRSTVQETQVGDLPANAVTPPTPVVVRQGERAADGQTCSNCRWWARHRPGTAPGEGICLLTKTESGPEGPAPQRVPPNTLARAAANDPQVGAVLLTQIPYVCSQWAPL